MKENYDIIYNNNPNLFGNPYPEFSRLFQSIYANYSLTGIPSALDLGCGQGRDSLLLANTGFKVTSIDKSREAIRQLKNIFYSDSKRYQQNHHQFLHENYYNLEQFIPKKPEFDLILLNSILYLGINQKEKELSFLSNLISYMKKGASLLVAVHQSPRRKHLLSKWEKNNPSIKLLNFYQTGSIYKELSSGFTSQYEMDLYHFKVS